MTDIQVEEIVVPERDCRCGSRFFVGRCKGEKVPRTFHKNPTCHELKTLTGIQFLTWNGVQLNEQGEKALGITKPTLNRRLKRRIARNKRLQARAEPATVVKTHAAPQPQTRDGLLPCTCGHLFTQHTNEEGYGCHINECTCERYTAGTAVIPEQEPLIIERMLFVVE
jgi:hypothetical protein